VFEAIYAACLTAKGTRSDADKGKERHMGIMTTRLQVWRLTSMKAGQAFGIGLLFGALSGCTAVPVNAPPRASAGQPPEVLARDSEQCDRLAMRGTGLNTIVFGAIGAHAGAQTQYMECMEAKGSTFN
jgi:hypothetical protein